MKILRKLLGFSLFGFVVLVVAVVVIIHLLAARGIKFAIETAGTKSLGVGVSVDDVDLSLVRGRLKLKDLVVRNPRGYKHDNLLELPKGMVEVNLKSLLSDTVRIKQLTLDGAVVVLEQKDLLRNNVKDILKAIPRPPATAEEVEGKKLHIDKLVISNTTVKVKLLPLPGKADTIPLKLSTIRMTDLGTDNKLSMATLMGKILQAIAGGITEEGKDLLPNELIGGLSGILGKTLGLGEDLLKGGSDAGKKILEGVQDMGKGLGEGLKGLLPGRKRQQ